MMTKSDFRQQFAAKAARVNTSITSTTNWYGVRDLIAEHLELEPEQVYVVTISKPGNVRPRFFQPGASRARLLVAMHTDADEKVPATVAAVKQLVAERGVGAAVATRDAGEWSTVAVLHPRGDRRFEDLAKCYPEAVVLPV
jgi:hypothetical protein